MLIGNISLLFWHFLVAAVCSVLFGDKLCLWMGNTWLFRSVCQFVRSYTASVETAMAGHSKCRNTTYPRSEVKRFPVPNDKVPWTVPYQEYKPTDYTAPEVLKNPIWADPEIRVPNPAVLKWNTIDKDINRRSHMSKKYEIVDNVPRNPIGRTGMTGRGLLGKWGPNHAADPIVTRWRRSQKGDIVRDKNGKNILQFLGVKRRDTGEWALPGGMVNVGEHISVTCRREFSEETMNSLEASPEEKQRIEQSVAQLFRGGVEIYAGYVDDPRNTDNSWMETVAYNFHDEEGKSVGKFKLQAGDDAVGVTWMDISSQLRLFASHNDFVREVARRHNASW